MLQSQFPDALYYNLLDNQLFNEFNRSSRMMRNEIEAKHADLVIIDEIQRLPELLNEVHLLIETRGTRFLMSGSSARSLRRSGVNLLGGRAGTRRLHPFISCELAEIFQLDRALEFGLLPSVYFSDEPKEDLQGYVDNYITEEVAAESSLRNLGAFTRFLDVIAFSHGQMINFERIANESQVPASTVRNYVEILKDTFLIHEVRAFTETRIRKPINTSKFYLFDIGVTRHLQGRAGLARRSPEFGEAFESLILQELAAFCDYNNLRQPTYWRSRSNFEVDFVFDDIAIEVKSSANVSRGDLKGLRALKQEGLLREYILVALIDRPRIEEEGIYVLPWKMFLDLLWSRSLPTLNESVRAY